MEAQKCFNATETAEDLISCCSGYSDYQKLSSTGALLAPVLNLQLPQSKTAKEGGSTPWGILD
jgi:hypothetical protein